MKFLFEERTRPGNVVPARGVYANGAHEQCGLSGPITTTTAAKTRVDSARGQFCMCVSKRKNMRKFHESSRSNPLRTPREGMMGFPSVKLSSGHFLVGLIRFDTIGNLGDFFSFHDIRRNRNDISIVFTRKQLEKSQISPFREMTSNLKQNKKKSAAIVSLSVCYPRFFFRRC